MDAIVGTSGAEAIFEEYLHGTDGSMRVTYDGAGNVTSTEYLTEPTRGADIYLTLDIGLQKTALEALNAQLEAVGSQCGATVALDPASGEVLVCLSMPTYSQEQYKNDWQTLAATEGAPLFNRATEGRYAPGSIMKLSTAVAALEEGIITPQTTVTDEGVYTYYDDFQPAVGTQARDARQSECALGYYEFV
jgi:penicillin-binding protein 2